MFIKIVHLDVMNPEILAIPEAQRGEVHHYIIFIVCSLAVTFGIYFIRGIKKDEVV